MNKDRKMLSTFQSETREIRIEFLRCHSLLHLVASRVLEGQEGAEEAVMNCYLTATRSPLRFESAGAVRSWPFRILINEALQIVRKRKSSVARSHEKVLLKAA